MTTIDSNGIIRYEDSDGAPTPPVLNLGMQSVSDSINLLKNRVVWSGTGSARQLLISLGNDMENNPRIRLGSDGSLHVGVAGDPTLRRVPFSSQSRTQTISFTSRSSYTTNVTFVNNIFTEAPVVTTNIATGNGSALGWISRATNITTSGFTLYLANVNGNSSAWSSLPVQWNAQQWSP